MNEEIKRLIKAADALADRFNHLCLEVNAGEAYPERCKECDRVETEYSVARAFVKD